MVFTIAWIGVMSRVAVSIISTDQIPISGIFQLSQQPVKYRTESFQS